MNTRVLLLIIIMASCFWEPTSQAQVSFERILGATFADSGDSGVRLDGADHVALIEKLIPVGRLIDADARDLRRSERGLRAVEGRQRGGRRGLEKLASIHAYILPVK